MKVYIIFNRIKSSDIIYPSVVLSDKDGLVAFMSQDDPPSGTVRHSIHEVEIDLDAGFQSTEAFELDEYGNRMVDTDMKTIEAAKMDSPKIAGPVNYREYA